MANANVLFTDYEDGVGVIIDLGDREKIPSDAQQVASLSVLFAFEWLKERGMLHLKDEKDET